jgi:hypothetical protein
MTGSRRHGGRPLAAAAHSVAGLALIFLLSGCSYWSGDPMPPPPPPPPSAAFDGPWLAQIRTTGGATGVDPGGCDAEARVTLDVRDGRFTLTQRHAKLAAAAPTARDIATSTYRVEIAADGSVRGMSNSNAVLRGQITDGVMQANIYGLLCYYSLTARRG